MTDSRKSTPEGFLNVSKPYSWTSHDVVALVRRLAQVRRVGHAGTLDPAATGVLAVAVGRATRLVDYMAGQDKSYCADIVLGASTTTDDAEGDVVFAKDPSGVRVEQIVGALSDFLGEIEQVPPQFSAVKLQGRKAYEIARSGGQANIAARQVTVRGMAVVGWEPPVVSVIVRCTKGTYIRSLARDLGAALQTGAHLGALVRLSSGPFLCSDSVPVEELRLAAEFGYLDDLLYAPDIAVSHLPAVVLPGSVAGNMSLGRPWDARSEDVDGTTSRVYSEDGAFLGLAVRAGEKWQPRVVLAETE